jgi:peptide/nickel transport system permease protein
MTGYLIRRVMQAIIVTLIVTMLTYLLLHLVPGGEVRALLGQRATPAEIAHYNKVWGFDQPVYIQYLKWIAQLLHGRFGWDARLNVSVGSAVWQALPKTVVLVTLGTVAGLLIGVPLGIYQAVKRYSVGDYVMTGVSFVGYAAPDFFIAILAVQWFAVDLHWFPAFAPQPVNGNITVWQILAQPRALVLPVGVLAFVSFSLWSRYMRSSALDNLVQDYVRTAKAKGASSRRVVWVHVFRNSLLTIVTLLGLTLPGLLAGDIFVEVVFNYPGMGLLVFNGALATDYGLVLATTVVATLVTILGNLIADLGYAMLDPRVRYS